MTSQSWKVPYWSRILAKWYVTRIFFFPHPFPYNWLTCIFKQIHHLTSMFMSNEQSTIPIICFLDFSRVYDFNPFITLWHYLVHPKNEYFKPNYLILFPYQFTQIRKCAVNLTLPLPLPLQLLFKYPFKTFISFIIILIFFSHTLWKFTFQSEAKWSYIWILI